MTGIQYARCARARNRLICRVSSGQSTGFWKRDARVIPPAAAAFAGRSRVQPAWIIGQNSAISPSVMIVLTRPFEKNTPRPPCEASSDWRNASSALSPSTMASTIGASG